MVLLSPFAVCLSPLSAQNMTSSPYSRYAYGDMNDDGFVDARDASLLLTLYARQSVGDTITLDQLVEEQKGQ